MLYKFLRFLFGGIISLLYSVRVQGNRYLPPQGCVVAANHSHMLDPIFLVIAFKNEPIHFLAKKELFEFKPLAWLLKGVFVIPVDRQKTDFRAMKTGVDLLKDGGKLGIFPTGTRAAGADVKAGVGFFALKGGANVLPVSIVAKNGYKPFAGIDVIIHDTLVFASDLSKSRDTDVYTQVADSVMKVIESEL